MKKNEKSEQQLKTLLQNNFQNYKIEYFSTIDSTNTYAKNLLEKNLNVPIENEGRLKNYDIRDDFLTKILYNNYSK